MNNFSCYCCGSLLFCADQLSIHLDGIDHFHGPREIIFVCPPCGSKIKQFVPAQEHYWGQMPQQQATKNNTCDIRRENKKDEDYIDTQKEKAINETFYSLLRDSKLI